MVTIPNAKQNYSIEDEQLTIDIVSEELYINKEKLAEKYGDKGHSIGLVPTTYNYQKL